MIVVGATLAAFVMDQEATWGSWLRNVDQIKASHPDGVQYFAAIQVDARGLTPFEPLIEALTSIGGEYWTYSLDDGRTEVNSHNRVRHIALGRNVISEYAVSVGATHILALDADLLPADDTLPKLLELNHPLVGGEVPTYALRGSSVPGYSFHVESHMNTAGYLLIANSVFSRLRWRWDPAGLTDDPCYHLDAETLLGVPTYVRKDCVGKHYPESIVRIESRGHDMRVER